MTGAPIVRARSTADLINRPSATATWSVRQLLLRPGLHDGAGRRAPRVDTHDVAIVDLHGRAAATRPAESASGAAGRFHDARRRSLRGACRTRASSTRSSKTRPSTSSASASRTFDEWRRAVRRPLQEALRATRTRCFARATLVSSNNAISDEFIKLHANKGGMLLRRLRRPVTSLAGTDIVLAINSFVSNDVCREYVLVPRGHRTGSRLGSTTRSTRRAAVSVVGGRLRERERRAADGGPLVLSDPAIESISRAASPWRGSRAPRRGSPRPRRPRARPRAAGGPKPSPPSRSRSPCRSR